MMTSRVLSHTGTAFREQVLPYPLEPDFTASAIIDLDGAIRSVNSDFTMLLGYSRADLADMRWAECGHSEDADGEAALIADLLVGTIKSVRIGKRFLAKDGATLFGDLRLTPLCDGDGTTNSLLAEFAVSPTVLVPDAPTGAAEPEPEPDNVRRLPYTASHRLERGERRDRPPTQGDAAATRAGRLASGLRTSLGGAAGDPTHELMGLMNHEIRTPLNAIIGFAEMLDHEMFGALGNPRYRQYAQHIQESGNRLLEFVSDMLNMVMPDDGGVQIGDSTIDPQASVAAGLDDSDPGAATRAESPIDVPRGATLLADPRVLTRILSFLVSDAIRSCGEGDQVTVSVDDTMEDGGLTYIIEDNGSTSGRAVEDSSSGQFGQLGRLKDGSRVGTGLGLPLCQWLVKLHGGKLEVDRREGVGTKVRVRLPESRTLRHTGPDEPDAAS